MSEDGDEALTGTWDGVKMAGKRINKNTVELRGKTKTRSYQLTATIKDGEMSLKYVVTRLDADGSYDGKATLTRVKPKEPDASASSTSTGSRPSEDR